MRLNRALGIAVDSKVKLEVTDTSTNIDNNCLNLFYSCNINLGLKIYSLLTYHNDRTNQRTEVSNQI